MFNSTDPSDIFRYLERLVRSLVLFNLRTPRSPWACPICKKAHAKTKAPVRRKKPRVEELVKQEENNQQQQIEQQKNQKQMLNKRLEPCWDVLGELENHECGWPFLLPVNSKQVATYLICLEQGVTADGGG